MATSFPTLNNRIYPFQNLLFDLSYEIMHANSKDINFIHYTP